MFRCFPWSITAALLGGLLAWSHPADASDRTAPQILQELDSMKSPPFDQRREAEPGYREAVQKQYLDLLARRDTLILDLFRLDPDHPRLPDLMTERWRRMPPIPPNPDRLGKEVDEVLAATHNDRLKAEAFYARAQIDIVKSAQTGVTQLGGVDDFVRRLPRDERSSQLLYMAALYTKDNEVRQKYEARVLKEYPNSRAASDIQGNRRQAEAIGKPFELQFDDAITGRSIAMKDLKGKVILIDFWATWCAPCLDGMPHLKELYQKYHDQGLEIIGVSLDAPADQGGLQKLRAFVQAQQIRWPQYYLGNGWDSEFTKSWAINVLPSMFLVDRDGKLVSTRAVEELDQMIPKLLASQRK